MLLWEKVKLHFPLYHFGNGFKTFFYSYWEVQFSYKPFFVDTQFSLICNFNHSFIANLGFTYHVYIPKETIIQKDYQI